MQFQKNILHVKKRFKYLDNIKIWYSFIFAKIIYFLNFRKSSTPPRSVTANRERDPFC